MLEIKTKILEILEIKTKTTLYLAYKHLGKEYDVKEIHTLIKDDENIDYELNHQLYELFDDKSYLDEFPMPIVRFYLKEMPKDIDEFRKSVWESAYIFTVPGLNDDDPHIYEDYSGKTRVVESSK